jgi:hypothetical protein
MRLIEKDPIAFEKVFQDEQERQHAILATKDSNSMEKPRNPKLKQLEAKKTRVSEPSKKSNAKARAWNRRNTQNKRKNSEEDQVLDQE